MVLPDVLAPGLKIVFCGTAAGNISARVGAYYAAPGNLFWDTLYRIGLTPRKLKPEEFRSVLEYGIGLTDLAKFTFGLDSTLKDSDFDADAFRLKMLDITPRAVAFTSKTSAQKYFGVKTVAYGRQAEKIGSAVVFVLPSPSGLARTYWNIEHWQAAADFVTVSPDNP
jgi:double-stranded uracil-DNA glycosylase